MYPVLGELVTPTGTIESEDQNIEYIVVNGVRIDVDLSYTFNGGDAFEGTDLNIEAHLIS